MQVFGPSIQPRHCLISLHEGVCTVTPLHADAITFVNGHHITQPTILHVSSYLKEMYKGSANTVKPKQNNLFLKNKIKNIYTKGLIYEYLKFITL